MSFVYDGSSLPTGKTDASPLPDGANPNEHIQAAEWEAAMQALEDLRNAILQAKFLGFASQESDPEPEGISAYLWVANDGTLNIKVGKVTSTGVLKAKTGGVSSISTLVDGANIATDASASNVFEVTLGGDRTLDNPTNLTPGFTYIWIIRQDGVGGHNLSFGSNFRFSPDATVSISSTASSVTVVSAICEPDGSTLRCGIIRY